VNAPTHPVIPTVAPDARQWQAARQLGSERGVRLIEALEDVLQVAPEPFIACLGAALGYPIASMQDLHAMKARFDRVSFAEALRRECLLLEAVDGTLVLVIADPFARALRDWAEEAIADPYRIMLAHRADVAAYLSRHEEGMRAMDSVLGAGAAADERSEAVEDLSIRTISGDASPVVKLVNSTLYDALKLGASDIHLESGADGLQVKYRVDGVLSQAGAAAGRELAEHVISRVKVMAELDIAERRVPQDGRFKVAARGREIDVRVSIMPSVFGEDAVLRILDKRALADEARGLRLDVLGFDAGSMATIRSLAAEPYGMLLVTGPTGSGKTTTLYAALTEINRGLDKIITIEDPVEYQLPGVLQIPVNEKKGLTFARGLRSILRHDPDKIMVGEIRDPETAQIAVQAALTGHLVLTTVHANNVFDVIGRFVHMQVEPHSFMSALNGIVAQRLMRVNCPHCCEDVAISDALLEASRLTREQLGEERLRAGRGCGHCRGTGFRGRRAIAEVLVMDDELRELIGGREPPRRVKAAAQARGFLPLREAALALVRQGESTLEEMNRVTLVG
jgi:general secretion pathway protein E